jgi:hypothetical protein
MMFRCALDSQNHDDVMECLTQNSTSHITSYGELILQLNCTYELATCTWSYAVFIPYLYWCNSYSHSHNIVKQVGTAYITGYMATEGLVKITLICNVSESTRYVATRRQSKSSIC